MWVSGVQVMEKIGANGIYGDLSIEDYHAQCCAGPSVSASGLKEIVNCPVKFWAFSDLNPNRFPKEETRALEIGRAAHALTLGEPEFNKHFIVSPYDDFRTKEARIWRDGQTQTVIKASDFAEVELMALGLRRSPQVLRAFTNGKPEQSIIWKDEETGVWLKSRPDWLPNDPTKEFLADYKTCRTIEPYALSNHVFEYGYHIQAAMQIDAVATVMQIKPLGIAHVCQEKDAPYLAELRMFTPEQIDIGRLYYRKAVRKFAECLSAGKWPGYTESPEFFSTPYRVALKAEGIDDGYASQKPANDRKHTAGEYLTAG